MGCSNSKKVSESPYKLKKHSRWRCIVGLEAKGIEFNAQVGLVHIGDEQYDLKNAPLELPKPHVHPIETPPGNRDPYDTVR